MAGGLLDYLYAIGVRNVIIITPGSTIQRKTINNLTPGHPKYLRGLQCRPQVITIDEYASGAAATAMADPDQFKVFVFTVQSLLRPTTKDNRRAHRPHETVGQSLSDYLTDCDDLVVIADEHHVYAGNAKKFNAAISQLDPEATIGLTATPDPATPDERIVFRYPLADAIADGFVKIPVLVARPDGLKDIRTQLADGLALLAAKEQVMHAYCKDTGRNFVQPVLFMVASTIKEATEITDLLSSQDMLGDPSQVLLITSEEPEEALTKLDSLEDPASPVKAVVSVSMLKEGWDVRNIYVIGSTRAMESQLLTEQILGRGLRLPFGKRTGVGLLDTVEVISHHAFSQLLEEAHVLLAQTIGQRTTEATLTDESTTDHAAETTDENQNLDTPSIPAASDDSQPTPAGPSSGCVSVSLPGRAPADAEEPDLFTDLDNDEDKADGTHLVGLFATIENRLDAAEETTKALSTTYTPRTLPGLHLPVFIPTVNRRTQMVPLSLTKINTVQVEALGQRWANDEGETLTRKALEAARDAYGNVVVEITDVSGQAPVTASQLMLPLDTIETDLTSRLLRTNGVEQKASEYKAAAGIARAFLTGAGVSEESPWRPEHARAATTALVQWLTAKQHSQPPIEVVEVSSVKWAGTDDSKVLTVLPVNRNTVASSRSFTRGTPYKGWAKSIYEVVAFDSYSAEFRLAELLDGSPNVAAWTRIDADVPLRISYATGAAVRTYIPDFLVWTTDGVVWVVEGKADGEMTDPVVIAKRDAAKAWVDAVNASDDVHTSWAYLLVSEATVKASKNFNQLRQGGQAHQ